MLLELVLPFQLNCENVSAQLEQVSAQLEQNFKDLRFCFPEPREVGAVRLKAAQVELSNNQILFQETQATRSTRTSSISS